MYEAREKKKEKKKNAIVVDGQNRVEAECHHGAAVEMAVAVAVATLQAALSSLHTQSSAVDTI